MLNDFIQSNKLINGDFRSTGSSGGKGSGGGLGGRGGGILFLNISNTLDIEGTLSADGDNYVGSDAGGGSGGSILIRTVTLEGSGTVQVSSVRSSLSKAPGINVARNWWRD